MPSCAEPIDPPPVTFPGVFNNGVGIGVSVDVFVGVCAAVGAFVGVSVAVCVAVGVAVGVRVCVAVGVSVGVGTSGIGPNKVNATSPGADRYKTSPPAPLVLRK